MLLINCEYHGTAFAIGPGDELGYSRKPVPRVLPILLGNKLLGVVPTENIIAVE